MTTTQTVTSPATEAGTDADLSPYTEDPETGAVHPTVTLTDPDGETIEVDELLAPLVTEIWAAGIRTARCCQDPEEYAWVAFRDAAHLGNEPPSRRAQIDFDDPDGPLELMSAIANSGPRADIYVRMVHCGAPDRWAIVVAANDMALHEATDPDEIGPSRFLFDPEVELRFPHADIPEMVERLRRHNRGEEVEPGPVDWSSVFSPPAPDDDLEGR